MLEHLILPRKTLIPFPTAHRMPAVEFRGDVRLVVSSHMAVEVRFAVEPDASLGTGELEADPCRAEEGLARTGEGSGGKGGGWRTGYRVLWRWSRVRVLMRRRGRALLAPGRPLLLRLRLWLGLFASPFVRT